MFLFKDGSHIQLWCWDLQPSRLCCPWKKGLWRKNTFLKEGSTMLKCAATIENTPGTQAHHHQNDLAPPEIPGCPRPALPQVLRRSRARRAQRAAGAADHCERTLKFEHEMCTWTHWTQQTLSERFLGRRSWLRFDVKDEHRHTGLSDHRMSSMSLNPSTDWMRPHFKKWGTPVPAGR